MTEEADHLRIELSGISQGTFAGIVALFFLAGLGLLGQVFRGDLPHQLLAIAFLLFCIEQARMAVVDLRQIALVRRQVQDTRLSHFHRITVSTIMLELIGFYSASVWLGWGAFLVLLSQVWFNALAGIQLQPLNPIPIQPWGVFQRLPVLMADGVGLIFVLLWIWQIAPLGIAAALLGLVLLFGIVKYVVPGSADR
jgi:hypothetical protein